MQPTLLDTNVLIAAMGNFYNRNRFSNAARLVVGVIQGNIQAYTFNELDDEYANILRTAMQNVNYMKGKPRPPVFFEDFLSEAVSLGKWPILSRNGSVRSTGGDMDQRILEVADYFNAILVTENLKDFPEEFRGNATVMNIRDATRHFPSLANINSWNYSL